MKVTAAYLDSYHTVDIISNSGKFPVGLEAKLQEFIPKSILQPALLEDRRTLDFPPARYGVSIDGMIDYTSNLFKATLLIVQHSS